MTVATGYTKSRDAQPDRYATSLLDACCFWDRCQGGTIHQYLPRLKWTRASGACVRGMGPIPVWHLELDGRAIGWTQCRKSELPTIDAHLDRNILDILPVGCEWMD